MATTEGLPGGRRGRKSGHFDENWGTRPPDTDYLAGTDATTEQAAKRAPGDRLRTLMPRRCCLAGAGGANEPKSGHFGWKQANATPSKCRHAPCVERSRAHEGSCVKLPRFSLCVVKCASHQLCCTPAPLRFRPSSTDCPQRTSHRAAHIDSVRSFPVHRQQPLDSRRG